MHTTYEKKIEINTTKNYSKFKFLLQNRDVNQLHKKNLIESMQKKVLVAPILINEKWEIIDGQHRFMALKELDKPVHYYMVRGYGIKETKMFNINNKNWGLNDYLMMYCKLKNKNYLLFKKYKDSTNLTFRALFYITSSASRTNEKKFFKQGLLEFSDKEVKRCNEFLLKADDFKKYCEEYKKSVFVYALVKAFKNENYDHKRMVDKLKLKNEKIDVYEKTIDNLRQIEDIYNYKSSTNRVRLF